MQPQLNLLYPKVVDSDVTPKDLLGIILKNRGVTKESYLEFINPSYPLSPIETDSVIKAIKGSVKSKHRILIYGDYDVDGIASATLMWQALNRLGAVVEVFIPHREKDGYGFRADSFNRLEQELGFKFDLLITVDNGIVANKEFELIRKNRPLKIIVIDHHLPDSQSFLSDVTYFHSPLFSGSALSWFVARDIDSLADLGLAALGTVTDCIPLTGMNRNIVYHGLKELRLNPSPGISKLIQISGAKKDSLGTYDLGYLIGPRINAVGRLDSPLSALKLLCSQSMLDATKYSQFLNQTNLERQELQKESVDIALQQVNIKDKIIIVSNEQFHPGVIGLIAGKLTEKYYLPSIVISQNGEISKGSCRSVAGLNIIETLRQFSELFIDLGGHPMAAGFTISTSNIKILRQKLLSYVNDVLKFDQPAPTIDIDAESKLAIVKTPYIKILDHLKPFGIGNPDPLFLFKNVRIVSKKLIGSNLDHLKLKLDDPQTSRSENIVADAIAFKKGGLDANIKIGDTVDLVANLSINTWNDIETPQLLVKEILTNN